MMRLSVNKLALHLVKEMIRRKEELRVSVEKTEKGATVIDTGVKVQGGYLAGRLVTRICLGDLGEVNISNIEYDGLVLPTISVLTDLPAISLLGSQFAGWRIRLGEYFAMGSGPARALSLKPKELYDKIGYYDKSNEAVIVLESNEKPIPEVIGLVSEECGITPNELYIILASTSSIAGSTQVSGRVLETGLYRMMELGLDPKKVLSGHGLAPIAPIHPKFNQAMGRTNDMILYGGAVYFTVDVEDDEKLKALVEKVPSSMSQAYSKPFVDVFKSSGYDFYRIDPSIFAPAVITVNNIRTGATFVCGRINTEILKISTSLKQNTSSEKS
ncbi:methenyltetrahydromethanopterin cyclohydrolase [Candidatus Bathyarchaeota archaeon]|nr:methenyltetrahydromethanopterin cyclohydrolase [Candidatus Bathyarchaeota archaeon]